MSGVALDGARLAAARLWAVSRMPYLASALFASTARPAPGSGTIAVDRAWHLHADPAVVASLDVSELGRLLLHLAGHLIRDHAARAAAAGVTPAAGGERWNRCADAEINDDLVTGGCMPAVACDVPASLGCAPSRLAEAYYADASEGPRRWDCGSAADGVTRAWEPGLEGGHDRPLPQGGLRLEAARLAWLERPPGARLHHLCPCGACVPAREAALLRLGVAAEIQRHHGREPGTVPGGWLRWAEAVLPSRVDWRRELGATIRRATALVAGSVDYTYQRPSRRERVSPGVILPSLVRPVPEVAIVCDTSGSMHSGLLARALAEVEGVLRRGGLRGRQVRVLAVDTAVHAVRRVSRASQVQLAGGGGTDMGRGIQAAAELRPRPSVIVVLTDGFTPWPASPPGGVRVVVGLLAQGAHPPRWAAPGWARTVVIAEP